MGTLQTPFSLNRYTYGLNNPLRYSDPSGHYAEHAGCYRDDRSYDWDCDHALNNDGQGVETDHPLYENADGTPKSSGYSVPAPLELPGPATTPEQLTQPNNGPAPTSNAAAGATASSGNLTYTPRALTEEEILTLFRQGNTSNAIADSANDNQNIDDLPSGNSLVTFGPRGYNPPRKTILGPKPAAVSGDWEHPNVSWYDFNIVGGCGSISAGFIFGGEAAYCSLNSDGVNVQLTTLGFGFSWEASAGGGVFLSNARSTEDLAGFSSCNAFSYGIVSVEICLNAHGRISVFGGPGFSKDVWRDIQGVTNKKGLGGHAFLSYSWLSKPDMLLAPSLCDFDRSNPICSGSKYV
jgi:hypothetical protein